MSPYEARVVLEPPYDGLQLPAGGVAALLDLCSCPGKHGKLFPGCWALHFSTSLLLPHHYNPPGVLNTVVVATVLL